MKRWVNFRARVESAQLMFLLLVSGCFAFGASAGASAERLVLPAAGDVTAEIQAAIDRLSAAGGGTVIVPSGSHDVHGVMLKDDVTLRLEKGCVLNGATNSSAYTTFKALAPDAKETLIVPWALEGLANIRAVVGAVRARNVALEGEGTIDGRGHLAADFRESDTRKAWSWRDVCFYQCKNVRVTGLLLKNAASWTCYFKECDATSRSVTACMPHACACTRMWGERTTASTSTPATCSSRTAMWIPTMTESA